MSEPQQATPFQLLMDLSEAGRQYARALPADQSLADDWRGIGFRLDGQHYVVPMLEVDEVLKLPACTKVPGVKKWLTGIANVRGRLLSVVDLGLMLGRPPCAPSPKSRVLSIRMGELYSGVIVDEVMGLQTFSGQQQSQAEAIAPQVAPYLTGSFEKQGQRWVVFSLHRLAEAAEFMDVRA